MAGLTYKSLMEEILDGNLKELRLHPLDMDAVENRIYDRVEFPPILYRFHDDKGTFLLFNDCKLRYDKNAELRNWS